MEILYYFESIRTPFFNAVFNSLTQVGDEALSIGIALFLYWCVSKKWGCYTLIVTFFSLYVNQAVKITTRISRPWVKDPNFTIVESARAAAVGYSFPSGHTATISATLGSWARFSRKTWLRILFCCLIVIVSFSRVYLGVHYPKDVLFSLAVSVILVFGLYPLYAGEHGVTHRVFLTFFLALFLSLLFVLFLRLKTWPSDIEMDNLTEARKNSFLMAGSCIGIITGVYYDKKVMNFHVAAPWWAQILKTLLGLGLLLGIKAGLKQIFPAALWWTMPRYFLVTVFATCIWPHSFPWFARGCHRKPRAQV